MVPLPGKCQEEFIGFTLSKSPPFELGMRTIRELQARFSYSLIRFGCCSFVVPIGVFVARIPLGRYDRSRRRSRRARAGSSAIEGLPPRETGTPPRPLPWRPLSESPGS